MVGGLQKWSGTLLITLGLSALIYDYALRHTPDDALASERAAQGVHDMSIMDHNLIIMDISCII